MKANNQDISLVSLNQLNQLPGLSNDLVVADVINKGKLNSGIPVRKFHWNDNLTLVTTGDSFKKIANSFEIKNSNLDIKLPMKADHSCYYNRSKGTRSDLRISPTQSTSSMNITKLNGSIDALNNLSTPPSESQENLGNNARKANFGCLVQGMALLSDEATKSSARTILGKLDPERIKALGMQLSSPTQHR